MEYLCPLVSKFVSKKNKHHDQGGGRAEVIMIMVVDGCGSDPVPIMKIKTSKIREVDIWW